MSSLCENNIANICVELPGRRAGSSWVNDVSYVSSLSERLVRVQIVTKSVSVVGKTAPASTRQASLATQQSRVQFVVVVQSSQMIGQLSGRRELSHVDVRSARTELFVVRRAKDDWNDVEMEQTEELFSDVVDAETVLEGQVELVVALQQRVITRRPRTSSVHVVRTFRL